MKKSGMIGCIALILFAAMILLTGCGSRDTESSENSGTELLNAAGIPQASTSGNSETESPGDKREDMYASAAELLAKAEQENSYSDYFAAFKLFLPIDGYRDSHEMAGKCCDGYIHAYFGGRKYMRPTGQFVLSDDLAQELNRMQGYGDADDFASLVKTLKAGDYPEIVGFVANNSLYCGKHRPEAGNLLWDEANQISRSLARKSFNYQTELDYTLALSWAANQLSAASDDVTNENRNDLFTGSTESISEVFVSDGVYEGILAGCGTNPTGKVLVIRVIQPYQYNASVALAQDTEYCLSFTSMEKLLDELFPASLAEIEYIIQCESKYQYVGKYDSGTQAVREYTTVRLLKFPGNEVLDETVIYGPEPEKEIKYTGKAPVYESGGKPLAEEVSAAVLRYCNMVSKAD